MDEEWQSIPGFDNYEASSFGRSAISKIVNNLFGNDGEGDCIHKTLLAEWMKEWQHPAMPDVDDRREAYYEAGIYPSNPL